MGSFADGMRMGQGAYQQMLDNQLRAEQDKRAAETHALDLRRNQGLAEDESRVRTAIGALSDASSRGLRVPDSYDTINKADGSAWTAPDGTGMWAPQENAPSPAYRPATDRDLNRLGMAVAGAKGDAAGQEALRKAGHEIAWTEGFGSHLKGYTGTDEQIGEAAKNINRNSQSLSMGAADKNGFRSVSVVAADGNAHFLKLSKQEQAQLYAAEKMLATHPEKALAIMGGINKELAAAVAAENGLVDKLATHGNTMAKDKTTIEETSRHNRAREGLLGQAAGMGGKAQLKQTTISVTDPNTGKQTKVPVAFSVDRKADGGPQLNAWTMDGKKLTDNKLLSQIASGEVGDPQEDSVLSGLHAQAQKITSSITADNYDAAQTALQKISDQIVTRTATNAFKPIKAAYDVAVKADPKAAAVDALFQIAQQTSRPENQIKALKQIGVPDKDIDGAMKYMRQASGGAGLPPAPNAPSSTPPRTGDRVDARAPNRFSGMGTGLRKTLAPTAEELRARIAADPIN